MSRETQTVEQARDEFLSMSEEIWDAMMVESHGGMFLTAVEQEALGLAILERVRRRQEEVEREDRPVHRPIAPEAPIPGRHWYGGCDPDRPRVRPDGTCESCGAKACPVCGHGFWPDTGKCGCA